jgi:YHS domain-containing protein
MAGATTVRTAGTWRTATTRTIGVLILALASVPAWAGMQWHADLAAARAASNASRRPVLAVFTASWSPESTSFEQQVLVAEEVEAVLTACFESVRIDVDQRPGITKRMQVAHVPSACVLGEGDEVLARFDCPTTSTAFVAAAARAAQDAAACPAGTRPIGDASAVTECLATDGRSAAERAAVGFPSQSGDGSPLTEQSAPQTSGRGSISLVTAKVRQLSDFATGAPSDIGRGAATAPAAPASPATAVATTEPTPSRFVSAAPLDPPTLPHAAPSSWPAEAPSRDSAFTNAPDQPAAARAIEPTSAATAWLAGPPTAGAAPPPAQAASSASPSDLEEKPTSTSTWSSFVSAFQKPFSIFSKPTKPANEPPTMPSARPTSPLAATTPLTVPPATPAASAMPTTPAAPASPDTYGSMPLGLEGYCPVTLAEKGVWTEGRAQWGVRHRGRTYLFAGPEQQQAFLASPDRFAPALSGDDPVTVVDQGKCLPGRRAYGVTYQSRMYLFSSPETRALFAANPERYTAPVMLAERPAPSDATRRY